VPHNIVDHADTMAAIVAHMEAKGLDTVEPTEEAEQAWLNFLGTGPARALGSTECTPGYYNNEGAGWGDRERVFVGDPRGALAYWSHMATWRTSGKFEGLEFQ